MQEITYVTSALYEQQPAMQNNSALSPQPLAHSQISHPFTNITDIKKFHYIVVVLRSVIPCTMDIQ